jgi:long-chain acyl-CoA synthetase
VADGLGITSPHAAATTTGTPRTLEEARAQVRSRQARSWPAGVPPEVSYPLGEIGMDEHLRHWARERPDHPAVVFYGAQLTYADLDEQSDRFAGWLAEVGVHPGDRVGVLLPNCPQFVVAFYGILKARAVHVPVNPLFREHELAHELDDAGVEVLVALDRLMPLVESVRSRTPLREVLATSLADGLPAEPTLPVPDGVAADSAVSSGWHQVGRAPRARRRPTDLDALAALNYTGGTTGMPKGCQHTQRHMLYTAATAAAATGYGAMGDAVLVYVPVFWIAGEDLGLLLPVLTGTTCVLLNRWDPAAVLRAIALYRVTDMIGTVDNYVELMAHPEIVEHDLGSLRRPLCMSFIRKLSVDLRRQWQQLVGEHSVLREGAYGMTETHTIDTFTTGFQDGDRDLASEPVFCGLPMPGTDILVVDKQTGTPLPLGERGEILVRSPSLLTGYWRRPDATTEVLRDGWLHTGDVGMVDEDGCVHYLGRDKEMIKVSGMSVFPAELEALLSRHPDIVGSAVVPVEDPRTGQVPLAFVQLRPGAKVDEKSLAVWCRQNMATYKVPRVRFVSGFPMTTTGKIKKGELLERARQN